MSGGSWEYVCFKIQDAADTLCSESCEYRRALGEHMKLISKAMHDIEWVDSADKATGEEIEAIKAVFAGGAKARQIGILLGDAKKLILKLQELGA